MFTFKLCSSEEPQGMILNLHTAHTHCYETTNTILKNNHNVGEIPSTKQREDTSSGPDWHALGEKHCSMCTMCKVASCRVFSLSCSIICKYWGWFSWKDTPHWKSTPRVLTCCSSSSGEEHLDLNWWIKVFTASCNSSQVLSGHSCSSIETQSDGNYINYNIYIYIYFFPLK